MWKTPIQIMLPCVQLLVVVVQYKIHYCIQEKGSYTKCTEQV